jgi:two-component system sensor histidine kinase/response regulator
MYINLDLRPMILMATATFWLLAVVTFLMGKAQAPVKGTRQWGIGNFCIGTGILLFAFVNLIPDFFSYVLSNTFIVLGLCYLLSGLWAFKEKTINHLVFIGLPIFTFIQATLFTNFYDLFEVRKILFSLTIIAGMILAARETYIPARRPLFIALRIVAVSSTIYAFMMVLRIIYIFMDPLSNPLHGNVLNLCLWVLISILQILNSIGFLLMFLYKQSMRLQSSINGMQRFFSILAHDLRGPLGTISMVAIEFNKNILNYPENQRHIIEALQKSSGTTYSLLEHLLEWGKNMLGDLRIQPKLFNLSTALNEEMDLIITQTQTKKIQIIKDLFPGLIVFADENMVHTIARNILSNAIKYTPEGGSIKVSSEQSNKDAVFVVNDTGIGISQEVIRELTEAHPVSSMPGTSGEKGYGLGLSFCQSLIEKNHGEMIIHSELGKGTTLRIKLPAY